MINDRLMFRAWISEEKALICYGKRYIYFSAIKGLNTGGEGFDCIEQCTGIRDKNGKLIYENDVVDLDDSETYAVVKWGEEDGCWRIITCENTIYTFDNLYGYELTIYGNIHENADLLEN